MIITTDRGNRERITKTRGCQYCPPHNGCNKGRRVKHGTQKPRSRVKRGAP